MANFSKSNVPQFSVDVYQNEYLPEGAGEVNAIVTVTATGGGTIGSAVAAPHLYSPGQGPSAAVAVMVDCSGSMDYPPTKMRNARDATAAAVDTLRDGVHFAVIGGRVRFHIDDAAAAASGIGVSSRLLALAVEVRQRR